MARMADTELKNLKEIVAHAKAELKKAEKELKLYQKEKAKESKAAKPAKATKAKVAGKNKMAKPAKKAVKKPGRPKTAASKK
jgi:hypothetical protein